MKDALYEAFERLIRFDVLNTTSETIPPFACMELDYSLESGKSALEINGSSLVLRVKKPTAESVAKPERFVFNGPMAIVADGFGSGYKLPILQALMDVATPPSPGDAVGPQDDSWLLGAGSGWVVKSLDSGQAYVDGDTASVFVEFQGGGGGMRYFWPPSGGIPAAVSTSSTLSVGSALCYVAIEGSEGNYVKGTETERVENEVSAVVGLSGKPIGCVRNDYGSWTVVVEDCGGSSTSTDTGGPTPQPDVGSPNSSESIDMGYSLGV